MVQPRHTSIAAQNHNNHGNHPPRRASLFPGRQWQQVPARDNAPTASSSMPSIHHDLLRQAAPAAAPRARTSASSPPPSAAEQSGFHACKRCVRSFRTPRPDPRPASSPAPRTTLARHATERTRLADLARVTGVGRLTLLRAFAASRRQPRRVRPSTARRPLQGRPAAQQSLLSLPSYPSANPPHIRQQTSPPPSASPTHLRIRIRLLQPSLRSSANSLA